MNRARQFGGWVKTNPGQALTAITMLVLLVLLFARGEDTRDRSATRAQQERLAKTVDRVQSNSYHIARANLRLRHLARRLDRAQRTADDNFTRLLAVLESLGIDTTGIELPPTGGQHSGTGNADAGGPPGVGPSPGTSTEPAPGPAPADPAGGSNGGDPPGGSSGNPPPPTTPPTSTPPPSQAPHAPIDDVTGAVQNTVCPKIRTPLLCP